MSGLSVTATWRGGYAARVQIRQHRVLVDEPPSAGGDDAGPMPTELLCAALASCFCLAIAHVAGKRGAEPPGLEVTVTAERAGSELRYHKLVVTARARMPEDELAPLVQRARRFCWISNILSTPPDVEYRCEPGDRLEVP